MTILELIILVVPISLASLNLSTISIRSAFLILLSLYLFLQIEILGGLFQTTFILFFDELPNFLWTQLLKTSHQYSNTSLSFMSILLNPLRKENISNKNNLFDEGDFLELSNNKDLDIIFKTWLVTNKLVKEYLNSKEFKTLIYKENSKCSGIYLWLNNKNGKYYIGSAKDFRNRLVRYYSPKELAITNNLIHRAIPFPVRAYV